MEELEHKFPTLKNYQNKMKANRKQIQTLEKLRDTLLPKLMSGAVRVRHPELTNLKDLSILQ